MAAHKLVYTQASQHAITVTDEGLTLTGCGETLSSEETEELLNVLLIWKYGLEAVSPDDLDG